MNLIDENFLNNNVGMVHLIHSEFNSVFSQHPYTKKLLPVSFENTDNKKEEVEAETIFEPNIKALLPGLIRHYLEMSVFQGLLESYLSEQAARMLAMQNATNNAKDMIEELKLLYNKSRQEKITSEILDISGGFIANG
jgi:F-type H+-transporting ATPase subunit gamma